MQLSNKSPVYQCQAKTHEGEQCTRQAIGYRRFTDGELYFACVDHIRDLNFKPIHKQPPAPVFPAPGKAGHHYAGK